MSEIPKQWLAALKRLLPRQAIRGDGNVQVGKMQGSVTVVNNVFHVNNKRTYNKANADQRIVLQLMRELPSQEPVLTFMQREFGTRMVIDLQDKQLFRLRRYVETIQERNRDGAKPQSFQDV